MKSKIKFLTMKPKIKFLTNTGEEVTVGDHLVSSQGGATVKCIQINKETMTFKWQQDQECFPMHFSHLPLSAWVLVKEI